MTWRSAAAACSLLSCLSALGFDCLLEFPAPPSDAAPDAGPPQCQPAQLTHTSAGSMWSLNFTWNRYEYCLGWADNGDAGRERVLAHRVSEDGAMVGGDHLVFNGSSPRHSLVARDRSAGQYFGLAFAAGGADQPYLGFVNLDQQASPTAAAVEVASSDQGPLDPRLAAFPDGFGLAWIDPGTGGGVSFAVIDFEGARVGEVTRVASADSAGDNLSLAWTGEDFGLVWEDRGGGGRTTLGFALLSPGGAIETGPTEARQVEASGSTNPCLTFDESDFILAWQEGSSLYLARLSDEGALEHEQLVTDSAMVGQAYAPGSCLARERDELFLAWVEELSLSSRRVRLTRVAASLERVGEDLRVTDAASQRAEAATVGTGSDVAVAWLESDGDNWNIFFARKSECQ